MSIYWLSFAIILFCIIAYLLIQSELFRYMKLHFDSPQEHIMNYQKVPRSELFNGKIIVSLTTTPTRISKIRPMLKSILNQSVRINEIALNIPVECKGKKYDVPDDILNIATVYYTGKDYGPATRCIPTILREENADTIIILLDDDYVYGYNFIENLIEKSVKETTTVFYTKGAILLKPAFVKEDIIDITKSYIDDNMLMKYIKVDKKKINYSNNYRSFLI